MLRDFNPAELNIQQIVAISVFTAIFFAGIIADMMLIKRLVIAQPDFARMRSKLLASPFTMEDGKMMILIVLGVYIILAASSPLGDKLSSESARYIFLSAHLLILPAALLITLTSIIRSHSASWKQCFGICRETLIINILRGVVSYVAMMPIVMLSALLYSNILKSVDIPVNSQFIIQLLTDKHPPVWFLGVVVLAATVIAPIAEELLFRGFGTQILSKKYRISSAIILVSLIFAVIHMHVPSLLPLFVLGCSFSCAYFFTGSITTSIVMHSLFNGISLTAVFMLKDLLV